MVLLGLQRPAAVGKIGDWVIRACHYVVLCLVVDIADPHDQIHNGVDGVKPLGRAVNRHVAHPGSRKVWLL